MKIILSVLIWLMRGVFAYGASLLLFVGQSQAVTVYADNQLSSNCTSNNYSIANRNCTGSNGNAYTTIDGAMSGRSPGDIINVRTSATVYLGSGPQNTINIDNWPNGTAGNHITVQTYPPDTGTVTVRGFVGSGNFAARQYITLRGKANGNGIMTGGNLVIRGVPGAVQPSALSQFEGIAENIEITDVAGDVSAHTMISFSGRFTNIYAHHNGYHANCDIDLGFGHACHAMYFIAQSSLTAGSVTGSSAINTLIENSLFIDQPKGYLLHCEHVCNGLTVRNSRFSGSGRSGFRISPNESGSAGYGGVFKPNVVYNVIVDNSAGWGLIVNNGSLYNVVAYNSGAGNRFDGNTTVRNSYAAEGFQPDNGTMPGATNNVCGSAGVGCVAVASATAVFADPAGGDFRPCEGAATPGVNCKAPAASLIGQGANLSSIFTTDINGTTRTVPWDVGAYKAGAVIAAPQELVAKLSCDTQNTKGGTLTDTSGKKNDGTLMNGVGSGVAGGKYNQKCTFDGVDDFISIASSTSLNFSTGFTLEAWVNPSTVTGFKAIFGKDTDGAGADDNHRYWLNSSTSTGFCAGPAGGYTMGGINTYACSSTPLIP